MNYSKHKLTLWILTFCLMLTVAISPALATAQAGSSDTSSKDTTKKSKKKAEKDKADSAVSASSSTASKPATTNSAPASEASKKTKAAASGAADSPEIAAAQASGKVWVNLDSGIYHKGGRWYGKTKNGKFMTEAEAKAAGYKESQK
jgi:cytoskeletal protein RodZ